MGGLTDLLWHCADTTDAFEVIAIDGAEARTLLAKGCSLDFHARTFPAGQCAGTVLAQIDVLIHKRAEDAYRIYCDRSWAGHVREWLADAHGAMRATAAA